MLVRRKNRSYKPNPGRIAIFVEIFTQTEAMRRCVWPGKIGGWRTNGQGVAVAWVPFPEVN